MSKRATVLPPVCQVCLRHGLESKNGPEDIARKVFTPPSEGVPGNPPRLRLSWIVYRGKGSAVTFSPAQLETWEDDRPWANSPWAYPS